ncbi:MAG: discoidin domain-containing protein [Polyangiaceae bacterium]
MAVLFLGCGNSDSGQSTTTPNGTSSSGVGSSGTGPASSGSGSSSGVGASSGASSNGVGSSSSAGASSGLKGGSSSGANSGSSGVSSSGSGSGVSSSGSGSGVSSSGSGSGVSSSGSGSSGVSSSGMSSSGSGSGSGGADAGAGSSSGSVGDAGMPTTGWGTVHNDFFWYDQSGNLINTRSGKIRQFENLYYWFGGGAGGLDQECYSSPDMVHWTYVGVALHMTVSSNRMDVLYNTTTQTYVMFLKYDGNSAYFGTATSKTPEGPYTFVGDTLVDGYTIGDMSMFQDDDGTAYLAYVWWETGPNREHGIYRMSADYLTLDERIYLWNIPSREAPHILKRDGVYYYGTSRTAGINPTATEYYMATNLAGPWSDAITMSTPGSTTSYETQCDFVFPVPGTQGTYYMYDGDRWLPEGGSEGDYVWLPMEFDDGGIPSMAYYQDWDFNLEAGTWRDFDRASRDLALGKTATASSDDGTDLAASVTTATTYENYAATRWESAASDPQWIMVDLGSSMVVDRVILKWYSDYAKAFEVQVSTDSTTWTSVYTTTTGASYSVNDVTFAKTTARYVRMDGTQRGNPNGYSLFAFMVLDDP